MKNITCILLVLLVLMSTMTISYADSAETAGGFSIKDFLINVLLTILIWRVLMLMINALLRPKKEARRKYRKKQTKDEENPALFDE